MNELTGKQRAALAALAHELPVTLYIGKDGVTDAVIKEAYDALNANELVKCALMKTAPLSPWEACGVLCGRLGAMPVQCIGRRVIIYRRNEKEPRYGV